MFKPHGVVGIISPWNAPLNLALGDAVPALLAGNAVVIKPSELTPLAVRRAVEAMNQVLPAGVLQVLIGAGQTGAALVDHVDMICVTGSPETGRRVMERASRRLTPVLLELGGKDPMIVLRDADLDRAANAAAWGGCLMTGQVCMSVERVYVEEPVAEAFTAKLVERVRALRVGANGADAEIDMGPFTSPRQVEIVERHVADAQAKGARVLTGGQRMARGRWGLLRTDRAGRRRSHHADHARGDLRAGDSRDGRARRRGGAAAGERQQLRPQRQRVDPRRAARHRAGASASRAATPASTSACCPPACRACRSAASSRAASAAATAARKACASSACAKRSSSSRAGATTEPAWFPYSTKRARQIERLMGLLFGW